MNPGYEALLRQLRKLHQDGETGVVHLFTEKSEYGRIAFSAGRISHISLHTLRGTAVLRRLLKAAIRSHRFEAGALLAATEGLPATPELLAALGSESIAAEATAVPSAPAASIEAPKPKLVTHIAEAELRLITHELVRELGPMAESLIAESLPISADALSLTQKLADQLMPAEGDKFYQRVRELLRLMQSH